MLYASRRQIPRRRKEPTTRRIIRKTLGEEIKEEFLKRYQPDYGPFKIIEINFKGEKEEVYLKALDERALFDLRNNHS